MPRNNQRKNKNGKKNGKSKAARGSKQPGAIGQAVGLYGRNALAPRFVRIMKSIGLPSISHTTHRYVQAGSLSASVGSLGIYQFRTNSLFDPDFTSGGHQPYGFDQFKTYYGTYMVTSSRIAMECISITSPTLAGVYMSTESSTGLTDAIYYSEPGRGQSGIVSPVFGASRTFEAEWSLKAIEGHDPADYSALITANPANSDFYTIFTQDSFTLGASPVLYWAIAITYDVTWRDPLTVASS